MNKKPLICINSNLELDIDDEILMEKIAEAGFDGLFTHWEAGYPIEKWAKKIKELGLYYQSLHAPAHDLDAIWLKEENEKGEGILSQLLSCLEDCARFEVPLMVMHVSSSFESPAPTDEGAARYEKLLTRGDELGVKVAFENLQGEEQLFRCMEMTGHKSLAFCWDSGHQNCYNFNTDMLGKFGKYLCGVHLNDNVGCTGGFLTSQDDAHMIPGDGLIDWHEAMKNLKATGYTGPLTFEIKKKNKRGRHTQDRYLPMGPEEFMGEIMHSAQNLLAIWERV